MAGGRKLFIFGGTGSLGTALIERYTMADNGLSVSAIVNYSRDECKHWKLELAFRHRLQETGCTLENIIGNVRDTHRVESSLLSANPHIVIVAAALKHIDRCEYATDECLKTNIHGLQNILAAIERHRHRLTNLETVLFVSTDKACSPVNVYGMSKAICERMMIEKAKTIDDIKFVCVRYGNVLSTLR